MTDENGRKTAETPGTELDPAGNGSPAYLLTNRFRPDRTFQAIGFCSREIFPLHIMSVSSGAAFGSQQFQYCSIVYCVQCTMYIHRDIETR